VARYWFEVLDIGEQCEHNRWWPVNLDGQIEGRGYRGIPPMSTFATGWVGISASPLDHCSSMHERSLIGKDRCPGLFVVAVGQNGVLITQVFGI
jgi:hypothetical protein